MRSLTLRRHQMETFSALLALCVGNSPVTSEFPSQEPVTRSFDVFFRLQVNKRLIKQLRRRWFETPSCSLWCNCNVVASPWISTYNGILRKVKYSSQKSLKTNMMILCGFVLAFRVGRFLWLYWPDTWGSPLQWRHNESDCVSNHRRLDYILNRLFRRRSKKTPRHWPLWGEFTGEFPAQWASYAENVSIWWRHHGAECFKFDIF